MLSWLNDPRHELGLMVMVAKQMPYVQVRFFPLCASYQEMSPILCVEDDDQPCKLFKAAPKIVLRQKKSRYNEACQRNCYSNMEITIYCIIIKYLT
jgi:hypothetical protein